MLRVAKGELVVHCFAMVEEGFLGKGSAKYSAGEWIEPELKIRVLEEILCE